MRRDDLEAAVAAGVLDAASAARLERFLETRRAETVERIGDEGVRFARGFHDVFITIGIVLMGIAASVGLTFTSGGGRLAPTLVAGGAALVAWALAEHLTRRRRLVLPSIALDLGFVLFATLAIGEALGIGDGLSTDPLFGQLGALSRIDERGAVLTALVAACLAAGAFFWRFRLPFAVATLAAALAGLVLFLLLEAAESFVLANSFAVLLAVGLVIFAAALALDLSDAERRTVRADMAFWLHLLAAPMVVHGLIMITVGGFPETPGDASIVVGLVVLLGLLAVVLDRRAPLVSVLGYFGVALYQIFGSSQSVDRTLVLIVTLLVLGGAVVLLGAGWQASRRALLLHLPLPALAKRLAPIPERI